MFRETYTQRSTSIGPDCRLASHHLLATLGLTRSVAAGDTDGNRQIDNGDLQSILAANSFNNPGQWDWTQGDFNGDGLVDNEDLQLILATGYFGTGPYAASTPGILDGGPIVVPEPGTLAMLACGLIGLWWWRRRRAT